MPYTTVPTKSPGEAIGSSGWNTYVRDNLEWLKDQTNTRHGCTLRRTSVTSMAHNVFTAFAWSIENEDTDSYHVAGSTDIVIPAGLSGMYTINLQIRFGTSPTNPMSIIGVNGTAVWRGFGPSLSNISVPASWTGWLNAGDIVRGGSYHATGSAQNDNPNSSPSSVDSYYPIIYCYKVA